MIYSSYLGRQWQKLWVMPAKGGDAFPVSYGDWDETNARWSPDGKENSGNLKSTRRDCEFSGKAYREGGGVSLVTETRRTLRSSGSNRRQNRTGWVRSGVWTEYPWVDEQQQFHAPKDVLVFADDAL